MTRVVIVAPTPMLRAGLRALLDEGEVQVMGEAAALAGLAPRLPDYDVLLLGDESLLDDAGRLLRDEGRLAVVVLSDGDRPVEVLRGLPLAGWGIASPDASAEELRSVVVAASQGMAVLPLPVVDRLFGHRPANVVPVETVIEALTAREREVLNLLSQGLSNKLIARELGISEHTVKYHVSSIFAKLGASSRTDAISRGARQGLITL